MHYVVTKPYSNTPVLVTEKKEIARYFKELVDGSMYKVPCVNGTKLEVSEFAELSERGEEADDADV